MKGVSDNSIVVLSRLSLLALASQVLVGFANAWAFLRESMSNNRTIGRYSPRFANVFSFGVITDGSQAICAPVPIGDNHLEFLQELLHIRKVYSF